MNISYDWLKDLIHIDPSPDELGKMLTNVGIAVEGIRPHGVDFVFDIDLTSNRPDCLSHLGVAREISVITRVEVRTISNLPLKIQAPTALETNPLASGLVTIRDNELCHRFTARIIRGVKIAPSPTWLVDRLEAIGERSINNVADITNFVMHELGQPMHAFDLDKLDGECLVVRRANTGETITTLDEVDRQLDPSMLAICDANKPVAIAGIMGGLDSSITDITSNVLLEVACFHRANIRSSSRKLKLATEASYRFERGVDIENLIRAADRAAKMICEIAGGEAEDLIDVYPTRFIANEIVVPDISAAVMRLTGLNVPTSECVRILSALGLRISPEIVALGSKPQTYISPSWRHDLAIEEDLVEEVVRHIGYETIASELPPSFGAGEYQPTERREKLLRQTLVDMGFDEAISYSFIDTKFDRLVDAVPNLIDEIGEENYITLQNSVIEGAVRMRPSVVPGLLNAVRLNFNHQRRDLRLFELGKVFAAKLSGDNLPHERQSLAMVVTGGETQENRALPVRQLDFYDAKGAIEAAMDAAGIAGFAFAPTDVKHLRVGQSSSVLIEGKVVGHVGQINDEIAGMYKFRQPVFVAEINLSNAMNVMTKSASYVSLSRFPIIMRDVSFVVGRKLTFSDVRRTIVEQNYKLCTNVVFADIYEGKGLAENERSITIRIEYRSDERTLVEEEVESLHNQIVSNTSSKLGIRVRS